MVSHSHKHAQRRSKKSAHAQEDGGFIPQAAPAALIQKAQADAGSLSAADVIQLQRTIGNRAVSQMVGGQPVQRLMGLASFKSSTKLTGKFRNKVKTIDSAITAYHNMGVADYQNRATQLGVIIARCNTYLGFTDSQAKRKAGVQTFLPQAQKEKEIYDFLVLYSNAGGRKAKYDELNKAQDSANQADSAGYAVDAIHQHINQQVGTVITDIRTNEPGVLQQILADDVAKLRAIALAPNTPLITQRVIAEVLANIGDVNLMEGAPGARLTNNAESGRGVTEKYGVLHALQQPGGTAERVGSLAHELTHVSSGETFDNTPLFLLFDPASTAQEITAMALDRKNEINALQALYTNNAAFSAKQKALIKDKLDYAIQDKLGLYVARFHEAKKIDRPTADKLMAVRNAIPENNTLIEYDSVVNQCLIYMQQWNIPQTDPFYVKLIQVAQDAYNERDDAR
jgi:hypothetical protein